MAKTHLFLPILLLLLLTSLTLPAHAQAGVTVVSDQATLTFPESALFKAEFTSATQITAVVLEYGVDQLTCGTVEAKAFPDVAAGTDVTVTWTWEMRQSGSLPPGASIWWRWQVSDAGGAQFTSPTQTVLWLDNIHSWQVISGGDINLHYYDGGASFGQQLHEVAVQALLRLSQDVGISPEKPVDIYIYANSNDYGDAVLFEPSWSGGLAFPENNIVIIGNDPTHPGWILSAEAHELTHELVGHLTFSCLGFVPQWLNEGLAMYGEGGPDAVNQAQFDTAKSADRLLSLRSLTGGFSEESDRANLSYTESFSVVDFMIKTYGQDKMTALLLDLRDGQTTDDALQAAYGFNTDGLEDAWRASIGAAPRPGTSNPTPVSTPTNVPTIVPIGAAPVAAAVVSTPRPTPTEAASTPVAATQAAGPTATAAPVSIFANNTVTILAIGLVCLVVILATIVGVIIIVGRQRRAK